MFSEGSKSYSGSKVLVTGASGFIGSHLCRRLAEEGAEIIAISRQARNGDDPAVRWWQADASNAEAIRRVVASTRPDYLFHLAGETRARRGLDLVLPTFEQNLASSINVLLAASEAGCQRIVLAGSLDEPGLGKPPSSPYAAAHVAIRGYMRMFNEIFATPAVIARIFMTYGPGQAAIQKLIPYTTLCLLRGEAPRVSSGMRLVDWIYVEDVANGLLALGQAPRIEGRTLDLASGQMVSVREVVEELVQLTGSQLEPVFGGEPDRKMEESRHANIQETYEQTGWRPEVPLQEGLRKTIAWYKGTLKQLAVHLAAFLACGWWTNTFEMLLASSL